MASRTKRRPRLEFYSEGTPAPGDDQSLGERRLVDNWHWRLMSSNGRILASGSGFNTLELAEESTEVTLNALDEALTRYQEEIHLRRERRVMGRSLRKSS